MHAHIVLMIPGNIIHTCHSVFVSAVSLSMLGSSPTDITTPFVQNKQLVMKCLAEALLHIFMILGLSKKPIILPKRFLYIASISLLLILPPNISISSFSPGSFTIYPDEQKPFFS